MLELIIAVLIVAALILFTAAILCASAIACVNKIRDFMVNHAAVHNRLRSQN